MVPLLASFFVAGRRAKDWNSKPICPSAGSEVVVWHFQRHFASYPQAQRFLGGRSSAAAVASDPEARAGAGRYTVYLVIRKSKGATR